MDWEGLGASLRERLMRDTDSGRLISGLIKYQLITEFQAERIRAGSRFSLILGNYRILEKLGSGGMGVVYKAEHLHMPRLAAIKTISVLPGRNAEILHRFFTEVWAVAQLQHANIVMAIDAGEARSPEPGSPTLYYFVMEYVAGQDLEKKVLAQGP